MEHWKSSKPDRSLYRAIALQTGGLPGALLTSLAFQQGTLRALVDGIADQQSQEVREAARKVEAILRDRHALQLMTTVTGVSEADVGRQLVKPLVRVAEFIALDRADVSSNVQAVERLLRNGQAQLFASNL